MLGILTSDYHRARDYTDEALVVAAVVRRKRSSNAPRGCSKVYFE